MTRAVLILTGLLTLALALPAGAQTPARQEAPPPQPAMSADQARMALEVLNDPAKRAAVAATLNAIVKTQPAATHA
ncbi:hypothetical protein, partial [Rhodopila globiformis]